MTNVSYLSNIGDVYKETSTQLNQFAKGYRRKHNTTNQRNFQMSWFLVASSHDIIKIPRTCRFVEIFVEINRQACQTCLETKLRLSMKIREIKGERIPTGQQLHRVKIITTKPLDEDWEDLPQDFGTFEEILQLTNIFSIKVNDFKKTYSSIFTV